MSLFLHYSTTMEQTRGKSRNLSRRENIYLSVGATTGKHEAKKRIFGPKYLPDSLALPKPFKTKVQALKNMENLQNHTKHKKETNNNNKLKW